MAFGTPQTMYLRISVSLTSHTDVQGDLHFYGKEGVNFYTKVKTVTTNWKDADEKKGQRAPGLDAVGSS